LVAAFVLDAVFTRRFRTVRGLSSSSTASSRTPISDPVTATLAAFAISLTARSSLLAIGFRFFFAAITDRLGRQACAPPHGSFGGLTLVTPDVIHHVGAAIAAKMTLAIAAGGIIRERVVSATTARSGRLIVAIAGRRGMAWSAAGGAMLANAASLLSLGDRRSGPAPVCAVHRLLGQRKRARAEQDTARRDDWQKLHIHR
jgi:hypothetical protein